MDASQDGDGGQGGNGGGGQGGKTDHAHQAKKRRMDGTGGSASQATGGSASQATGGTEPSQTSTQGKKTTGKAYKSPQRGKSRSQPGKMQDVCDALLEEKQRRAIRKCGLGNTLNLQFKEKIYYVLVNFLIGKVNVDTFKLELGDPDDPVKIDLFEAAAKVFGVQNEGRQYDIKKFAHGKKSGKRKYKNPTCMNLKSFTNNLKRYRNMRKLTCEAYMYCVLGHLLAPNTTLDIDLRFKDLVEDDDFKGWNLVDLIVRLLVQSIKDINNKKVSYLNGSPMLLIVIFLDMIDDAALEKINRKIKEDVALGVFPRINHVRDAHLKWLSRMKTSDLNALRIKPLSESFYAEEKVYWWHSGYDWCEGATDEWDEGQDCHISSLLENIEVATHKNGESSNNSIIRHQLEAASCVADRIGEAFSSIRDDGLAIASAVKRIVEEHAPSLPEETISSLCEALESYVLSLNTNAKNKLNAVAEPLDKFCALVQLSNEDAVNKPKVQRGSAAKDVDNKPEVQRGSAAKDAVNKPEVSQTGRSDAIYQYPADGSCEERFNFDCIDLKSLSEDITDQILELHLKHLRGVIEPHNLNCPSSILNESIIFHSHLCSKLRNKEYTDLKHWVSAAHGNERSVGDIKYFFIPVHEQKNHYSLVIIYRPQGGDSATNSIFHMDSLSLTSGVRLHKPDEILELAESFATKVLDIKVDVITKKELEVPQQGPTNDCGFFVVYNIKKVLEQASEEFSFDQIRGDWYEPKDASALRNDTYRFFELNKLKYIKPVPRCKLCDGGQKGHISLLKKFKQYFSS